MSAATPELFRRMAGHGGRTALDAPEGTFTYAELLDRADRVAGHLLNGAADLDGARVAFLAPPGLHYVATLLGIWRAGGIAVPLAIQHPPLELAYTVRDSDAARLLAHPDLSDRLAPLAEEDARPLATIEAALAAAPADPPAVVSERGALLLYTSGTTSRPKGVLSTHANLAAQMQTLVDAWEWRAEDRILHVLPLHHIHGIVNVLGCALWSGARCDMLPGFDADAVWARLASGDYSLFMAVPTIYNRLIRAWDAADADARARLSGACRRLRLMVSGSAPLPVSVLEQWHAISGHTLLERYGMTETGMILSNPLHGERRPGTVGTPLPGLDVRRVNDAGEPAAPDEPAEIRVRGPGVFREYWRRPEATEIAFQEGWFRTGDVSVIEDDYYRLLGRQSVDIIKTGGYKVSALEIEEVLRTHPDIAECAVVGVPDDEWGERVAAAVILRPGRDLALDDLRGWGRERLAPYKLPTRLHVTEDLPRNAMGKVTKPAVAKLFE